MLAVWGVADRIGSLSPDFVFSISVVPFLFHLFCFLVLLFVFTSPRPLLMPRRQLPFVLVLAVLVGIFVARVPQFVGFFSGQQPMLMAIDEARDLIRTRYVDPISDEQLVTGAISGMADALGDPYSQYIAPTKVSDFHKDLLGQFVGIGATVRKFGPHVLIVTPLPKSPALLAGLQPGDRIEAIDGSSVAELTLEQCIDKLKGVPGTSVTIDVLRGISPLLQTSASTSEAESVAAMASAERLAIKLMRAELNVSPVRGFRWDSTLGKWDFLIDPAARIAYIRIEQFSGHASSDVQAALDDLRRTLDPAGTDSAWIKGMILDLRDNPGGLLDDAIALCDMFMDSGTIVSTRSRVDAAAAKTVGRQGEVVSATAGQVLPGAAIAILVNGRSASASEVVSGALAEQTPPRAIIVGTRTFGKGLVQATEPLTSGGILKLTEQFYFLPSGRLIQRKDTSATWGVDPTPGFFVDKTDAQLIATMEARDTLEAVWPAGAVRPMAAPGQQIIATQARLSDADWVATKMQDVQLAAAITAVQGKLASGQWMPPAAADGQSVATAQTTAGQVRSAEIAALERSRDRFRTELDRIERRLIAIEGGTPPAAPAPLESPASPALPGQASPGQAPR